MEISAQLVKRLRDKTGAGMMDCKRALVENNGDIEKAEEFLRKKGLMDAAKKSTRTAADGLIGCAFSDDKKIAALVEINSETDFVARNDKFQTLVENISKLATEIDDLTPNHKLPNGKTLKEEIDHLISIVGENITFRRAKRFEVKDGVIATYIHNASKPKMGKIGVLVQLECDGCDKCSTEDLEKFGKKIAMHIAAANPAYLCPKCVPDVVIAKEKEIIIAQAKELGKPENIAEKMAEGRIKKYFEENTLMEQVFVMDGKTKVSDEVAKYNKEHNSNVKITGFAKFVLGEGIDKTETNFVEEVASFIK